MTAPRRWSFSLRTLFVVVTLLGCWLGYYANVVAHRRHAVAVIESHGGFVIPCDSSVVEFHGCGLPLVLGRVPSIPAIREWLGDVPVSYAWVRRASDIALARGAFSETDEFYFEPPEDSSVTQIDPID